MTFTFKLARRLAVSRHCAMLFTLVLLAACSGDSTAPDGKPSASPSAIAPLQVSPQSITVQTNQPIKFRGQVQDSTGELVTTPVVWEATGGTIDATGTFSSSTPGTYRVIARRLWDGPLPLDQTRRGSRKEAGGARRQHPFLVDTSVVYVVPFSPKLERIAISPTPVSLKPGAKRDFRATGFLSNDSAVAVGVTWSATGGDVDASGTYTAGPTAGAYHVIAVDSASALADTAAIVVNASSHLPALARVVLIPARRTVPVGGKLQYRAYGRTGTSDTVSIAVAFTATGGTISSTGLYTAGSKPGTFKVIARESMNGMADTTQVTVAPASTPTASNPIPSTSPVTPPVSSVPPHSLGKGVPFGAFAGQAGTVESATGVPFSLSMEPFDAGSIVSRINRARANGLHLMIAMTSGKHDKYKTNGVFDMSKWLAKMNTYNTTAIKAAIAAAVADGTIIGNSVMDEPHNTYTRNGNSWGPAGTMTKARVDQMCGYVKEMFPSLPVGVVHDHNAFEPTKSYRVCDFIVAQYAWRKTKGDIAKFRDDALALGRRDGIAVAFSMNLLDGGIPAGQGECSASRTGGRGLLYADTGACMMTATQIRDWGETLGPAGCAMLMWRYDPDFFSRPDNIQAFRDIAGVLARAPAKSCRRRS